MKLTAILTVVLALGKVTATEPSVSPESICLTTNGLAQIKQTFQGLVDEGKIVGALTLISRKGQIAHWETYGHMDLETKAPMTKNAIFRIASMAKAVTAVAVLQLMEQGQFQLDDPIEKYLPVFKRTRVLDPNQEGTDPNEPRTVPLNRSITIRDLLRHTSGIQYGGPLYRQAGLPIWEGSLKEFVDTLSALPLAFQPGTKFQYSYATDVLGYLVEVIAEQPLDSYFQDHIFDPLAMHDTGFVVPPDKVSRLTNHYAYQEGKLLCKERAANSPFLKRAQALSGGGGWSYSYPGLVTTSRDWWRFMEMLRNHGQLDGQNILKNKSVKLMCRDHLGDIPGHFEPGTGHGLGVGIITDTKRQDHLAGNGMIYWAGAPHNTYYFIDFENEMCALLFMQNSPFNHLNLMNRFLVLAHKAIEN